MTISRGVPVFIAVTLGMLTAFGPFVTDFYLPVMPEMVKYFHTSPALVSMSLTTGMIGLAAGQVLIGPLTDKYGRRHILIGSMVLFSLASLLCIFSEDIITFNLARLFQGIAGAGGIVISKSMATDMYSGSDLARFMAILGAINGVAPVCAPLLGGVMSGLTSWQGIFGLLMAIGMVLLVCSMLLKETLLPENKIRKNLLGIYANLFRVFRNPVFSLCTFSQMACHITLFGYIAASPFILQETYGLTPLTFSICFAINAFALGVGSIVGARFRNITDSLHCGGWGMVGSTACLAIILMTHLPIVLVMLFYVTTLFSFGLTQPGLTATALDSERHNAGAASAMYGASGFLAGAIISPVVAIGRIELTSAVTMTAGALCALFLILSLCHTMEDKNQTPL